MMQIEAAAREVVQNWEKGDLAAAVRQLDAALKQIDSDRLAHQESIAKAREQASDDLEIDDLPLLSVGEDGVWVSAWVWVPVVADMQTEQQIEWLILPDEETALYTNWDDGRPGDASELVSKVNADPALNEGHTDWRLPTIDELKTLIGTDQDPKCGWYWSASPLANSSGLAWSVAFSYGNGYWDDKSYAYRVRLVRSGQ